jgi:hypothetical protein
VHDKEADTELFLFTVLDLLGDRACTYRIDCLMHLTLVNIDYIMLYTRYTFIFLICLIPVCLSDRKDGRKWGDGIYMCITGCFIKYASEMFYIPCL